METMELEIASVSGFCIQLVNQKKVKCLGIVKSLEVEAYVLKAVVDFHVMLEVLGAYSIILMRPWLREVNAIQHWRCRIMSLGGRTSGRKLFDMDSRDS